MYNKRNNKISAGEGILLYPVQTPLDVLTISQDEFPTVTYTYEELPICPDRQLTAKLKELSINERIDLVVGAGLKDMLMNSSYIMVPGAADNTTSALLEKGIPNIVLADGPAGIRIQRRST